MEAPQERSPLIYQSPVVPAIRREDCPGLYTELQIELTSALDQISNHQVAVDLEALLRRATNPESIWKLQRWFGLGKERRLREAGETMDQIINNYMSMKQEEMIKGEIRNDEGDFSLLEGYTIGNEIFEQVDHKVIKDSTFGLIFAIEDTTSSSPSRFFWLLAKNPKVETKIRQELETIRPTTEAKEHLVFQRRRGKENGLPAGSFAGDAEVVPHQLPWCPKLPLNQTPFRAGIISYFTWIMA
ncbi:hypothetical protein OIU77_019025 [Salix suchowensis]|uniref:Uncharacterized protein n=1 Tax=Salix suchowensis TaxID=1278906 RepID=A0ABQ9CEN6_9ROSI|nr:hypothetical protein OIU77_019025 [Salix suchowensis]